MTGVQTAIAHKGGLWDVSDAEIYGLEGIKIKRMYENIGVWLPDSVECAGAYDIPQIMPIQMPKVERWIPFNHCMSMKEEMCAGIGCHMFVDDYQITRLWRYPTRYSEILKRYTVVCTPDYSVYTDIPTPLNLFNHYRKHWLGAYWQRMGLNVLPTICWGGDNTFEWCFDGEPENSPVAVSSIGTQRGSEDKAAFLKGYDAMLERLKPSTIVFYGNAPAECRGNIINIEAFYKSIERRCGDAEH